MKKLLSFVLILACLFSFAAFSEEIEKTVSDVFAYEMADGDELYIENMIFNQDVVISGGSARISFQNCIFNGDIILTSETNLMVFLMDQCIINGSCVFQNGVQETHVAAPFPKFCCFIPVNVIAEDCFGAVINFSDNEINFNGVSFDISDAQFFYDCNNPDAGYSVYTGQEADCFLLCQWWVNGERILWLECEKE